jgi:DNA-binding transcriptional regulator YhcF (GntR family)
VQHRAHTVVEKVVRSIAGKIASGAYRPGERLPSVRDLARQHRINPSTVQVVMGKLQSGGLVDPVPRVGFVVRDISLVGGIESWRSVFRFSQRVPERATRLLEQLLATRLLLVGDALAHVLADPRRRAPAAFRQAVARLEVLLAEDAPDPARVAAAELHAIRTALAGAGQEVALALFNSIWEIVFESAEVLAAIYAHPKMHLPLWRTLLDAWDGRRELDVATLSAMLREFDVVAVQRLGALLSAGSSR